MRSDASRDEAFDGLTAEEIRRIRGAAEACRIPGTEGLARSHSESKSPRAGDQPSTTKSGNKRGRRA